MTNSGGTTWRPLLAEPFAAPNGYEVHFAADLDALRDLGADFPGTPFADDETAWLFAEQAASGERQFYCVRDSAGAAVAVGELMVLGGTLVVGGSEPGPVEAGAAMDAFLIRADQGRIDLAMVLDGNRFAPPTPAPSR